MSLRDVHVGPLSLSETLVGLALAGLAVAEYTTGDDIPQGLPALHIGAALLACLTVGALRRAPALAAVVWSSAMLIDAAANKPAELLGAGFAMLIVAYGVGHGVTRRHLRWVVPLVFATSIVRDLADPRMDTVGMLVDVAFIGVALAAGLALRRRANAASRLERDLADVETRTAAAIDAERSRLARELHDIVAHAVSVMVVQAGTTRPRAERFDDEIAGVLEVIEVTGREALVELRRLLGVLRGDATTSTEPVPTLDDLDRLADRMRQSGLDVHLDIADVPPLSSGLALCVHRVVQEGLTNSLRHAPGSRVDVLIKVEARALTVSVIDDGTRGGAPDHPGSGVGLVGLRERVSLFGGTLTTDASDRRFELRAHVPLVDGLAASVVRP